MPSPEKFNSDNFCATGRQQDLSERPTEAHIGELPKLVFKAITPMEQKFEAGCAPTSIAMAFSGFGIDLNEQMLIDRYFPTVKLPKGNLNRGVSNEGIARGIVQIIKDLDLEENLQLGVFVHELFKDVRVSQKNYIVEVKPQGLRKHAKKFKKGDPMRDFFETLEQLVKRAEIKVYTANNKMMQLSKDLDIDWNKFNRVSKGFYGELFNFISRGHIVGVHGGLTMHARALDGSRMEKLYNQDENGYVIIDPERGSSATSLQSLTKISRDSLYGDAFDYLFRISLKEKDLVVRKDWFSRFRSS